MRLSIVFFLMLLSFFARAQSDSLTIYCIGNSITQGSGLPAQAAYPAQLQAMVGPAIRVKNFGVSGATALFNGNKPYSKEARYVASLTGKADIIIIKLGTNDSKPANWQAHAKDFSSSYTSLVKSYQKVFPNAKILLLSPLPAWANSFYIDGNVIANQISPLLKEIAQTEKLAFHDLAPFFSTHRECFPDGVHPDTEGAKLLAWQVLAKLQLLKWVN